MGIYDRDYMHEPPPERPRPVRWLLAILAVVLVAIYILSLVSPEILWRIKRWLPTARPAHHRRHHAHRPVVL